MEKKEKILIVEDDKRIRNYIETVLKAAGYDVLISKSGSDAMGLVTSHCPELVLLDLGLPDIDGLEVLKSIREWSHMPIVVVSARTDEGEKVSALDLGADDYITKPFGTSELLARIRTAIRHTRSSNPEMFRSGKFVTGELTIDYEKRRVYVAGRDVGLTQNEYKLVSLLGKYAGRVLTYDFIIKEIWGPNMNTDNRILRENMANIRRKIEKKPAEPQYIYTEVGVGYRMEDGESVSDDQD